MLHCDVARTRLNLVERLYLQRRNLNYRLNRRIAGGVGYQDRLMRARKRRRERELYHRRVVARGDDKKKKLLPRPSRRLGMKTRIR